MNVRNFVLAASAALAFAFGGCSSGSSDSTGRATAVSGVPDGAPFVDQKNLKFHPTSLKVATGEVVYFKNSESTLHTVTVNGKNESGTIERDAIFQWTPPAPGEYKISCEFHPQMKLALTVE